MMTDKPNKTKGGIASIEVSVHYQAESKTKPFERGAKVAQVLSWAIEAFGIDDAVATELELVVAGTQDELSGSKPIASLAHGGSTLAFDLVRGEIANGAS